MSKVDKNGIRKKTGGRQKGTPNKATQAVQDKLHSMNCDPISGMAKIANQAMAEGDHMLAASMYKELAKYYAPTMKSIEFKGEMDTKNVSNINVDVNFHDLPSPD